VDITLCATFTIINQCAIVSRATREIHSQVAAPSKVRKPFCTLQIIVFILCMTQLLFGTVYLCVLRVLSSCCQCHFSVIVDEPRHPCHPSPCGSNAICRERNGAGACQCLPEYFGDPYTTCRPECVLSSDCHSTKACINNKCKDPCDGTCGLNAKCFVINHTPSCSCLPGYTGNALESCVLTPQPSKHLFLLSLSNTTLNAFYQIFFIFINLQLISVKSI
jgi:hypothetical protein